MGGVPDCFLYRKRKGQDGFQKRLDYTDKYPLVAAALKGLGHDVIIDGEVVVFTDGRPDFDILQKYNGHRASSANKLIPLTM